MDASSFALSSLLLFLAFGAFLLWLGYSLCCRMIRAFTRTTRKTRAVIYNQPYRRR